MARVFLACICQPSVMLSAAAASGVEGSFVCEANGHDLFVCSCSYRKTFSARSRAVVFFLVRWLGMDSLSFE